MSGIFEAFLLLAVICWIWGLYEFFADLKGIIREGEVIKMLFLIVIFPFVFFAIILAMVILGVGSA